MQNSILHTINSPLDLKHLSNDDLRKLAKELRDYIINIVATKEGHLGASLGVTELTIALHYVFDTPRDLLVWDVGHQAYGHKILTGRRDVFTTNRQFGGISGFPKRTESEYDTFGTGHSSTSISAALGMAIASRLKGENKKQHIAVIGDASIASGMAFEALNHAGVSNTNLLVILNDNAIGIDPSVGALKKYLTNVKKGIAKDENIFEALNFNYHGPIDGHDLDVLINKLEELKHIDGPKLLHIITTKGKGLKQAEENQIKYHAPGIFDSKTGNLPEPNEIDKPPKYQDVFGKTLVELAEKNDKIIGLTPAMPTGSSLNFMMEKFPERTFDVGIAEQHAVTFSAGLATEGLTVYCAIYSTFLQRAYDQVIHDVALQKLPIIFCIDRAGLVGADGATHHGAFDIAYLRCIPNLIICSPKNEIEFRNLLYTAQFIKVGPIAIRYPRGRGKILNWKNEFEKIEIGTGELIRQGNKIAILCFGTIIENAIEAVDLCSKPDAISIYNMRFVKPLDQNLLRAIFKQYQSIITLEDGVVIGGFGSAILEFANTHNYLGYIENLGITDQFLEHGTVLELQESIGLDPISISKKLNNLLF